MPDIFEKTKVSVKANIYFDGKVQSRTIVLPDGTRKTLGVYLPGDYEFHADTAEVVEITNGKVDVLFPGEETWTTVAMGGTYSAPRDTTFKVRCEGIAEYICDYLD